MSKVVGEFMTSHLKEGKSMTRNHIIWHLQHKITTILVSHRQNQGPRKAILPGHERFISGSSSSFPLYKAWRHIRHLFSGTLTTDEELLEFADEFKCYLQQDLFGTEVLVYQFSPQTQMPSDAQRIARVQLLIEHGFKDRVLMSHDIHTKQRLVSNLRSLGTGWQNPTLP